MEVFFEVVEVATMIGEVMTRKKRARKNQKRASKAVTQTKNEPDDQVIDVEDKNAKDNDENLILVGGLAGWNEEVKPKTHPTKSFKQFREDADRAIATLGEAYLREDSSSFYVFRTDTNAVLARGLVGYERAKEKANQLRKTYQLKWDQVSFKKERKTPPRRTPGRDPRYARGSTDAGRRGDYRGSSRVKYWNKDWDE